MSSFEIGRRIGARMALCLALWLLAPAVASAQLAAPLDTVPRLFAAGSYRESGAIVLGALAEAEQAASARQRGERAGLLVQAYADNQRPSAAAERIGPAADQRPFNLAQIAGSAAIDGDAATARRYLAQALEAPEATRDGYAAATIAEAQARLGDDVAALATARSFDNPFTRALALSRIAVAGPSGRRDGASAQAWAEMRGWNPGNQRVVPVPYILATLTRAAVRNGEGNSALDRAAAIADPQWRATAFAWAAAELAAWQLPGLANQGLRRAEEAAGFDRAASPVVIGERVTQLPLTWIAYAYARMGEQDQAQRAMEALLLTGAAGKDPVRRMEALAYAANAIGRTRQHVAEAEARARAVVPPAPPAPPPGK